MNWAITHNFEKITKALRGIEPSLPNDFKAAVQQNDESKRNELLGLIPQDERLHISLELSNEAIGLSEQETEIEFFLR